MKSSPLTFNNSLIKTLSCSSGNRIILRFTLRRLAAFGQRGLEFIFAPLQSKMEQTWFGSGLDGTMNMNSLSNLEIKNENWNNFHERNKDFRHHRSGKGRGRHESGA